MSASNMYRTGDYVYVDAGPVNPFGVRRIDELQKSASGNVEMEVVNWKPFLFIKASTYFKSQVMIYMRRIDLPKEVLNVADENLRGNTDFCAFAINH